MNFKSFQKKGKQQFIFVQLQLKCVGIEIFPYMGHIKRNIPTKMYNNMAIPSLESYQKRVEKVRVHVIDCANINTDLKS